jgi:WD40 repeat protein
MDFFDPQKQKQHARRLAVGYTLIGVLLILATIILIHQAYGYGVDKEGRVIQNGLLFVASQPRDADVYLNNEKQKNSTNARLALPSGQYLIELKRAGYHTWKRILTVEGGSVERFDYPLLIPTQLTPSTVSTHQTALLLSTVSPNDRWLLVAAAGQNKFELFDTESDAPAAQSLPISDDILAARSTTTGWQTVEWAADNRHVLLKRTYDRAGENGAEYILFDREKPESSLNLSVTLGFTADKIELRDRDFDRYYLYDQNSDQIFTASLDEPTPQPLISSALNFASHDDTVAYVTPKGAPEGKVWVRLKHGSDPARNIKQLPVGSSYLLDLSVYKRKLYLAAGAVSDNRVFLYGDPFGQLKKHPADPLVPLQILQVKQPGSLTFSPSSRFVTAENADNFATYDIETDRGFVYKTVAPMDKPQTRARWIDNFRLSYVSGGKIVVFDFDGTNLQKLTDASPAQAAVFDRERRYVYFVSSENALSRALLLTPDDQ